MSVAAVPDEGDMNRESLVSPFKRKLSPNVKEEEHSAKRARHQAHEGLSSLPKPRVQPLEVAAAEGAPPFPHNTNHTQDGSGNHQPPYSADEDEEEVEGPLSRPNAMRPEQRGGEQHNHAPDGEGAENGHTGNSGMGGDHSPNEPVPFAHSSEMNQNMGGEDSKSLEDEEYDDYNNYGEGNGGNHPGGDRERPYVCHQCDQRFKRKHHLSDHERTHNGDKPFECKECGKKFRQKGTLTVHLRVHTKGDKPFLCLLCQRRFNHKVSLTRHAKSHGDKAEQAIGDTPLQPVMRRFDKGRDSDDSPPLPPMLVAHQHHLMHRHHHIMTAADTMRHVMSPSGAVTVTAAQPHPQYIMNNVVGMPIMHAIPAPPSSSSSQLEDDQSDATVDPPPGGDRPEGEAQAPRDNSHEHHRLSAMMRHPLAAHPIPQQLMDNTVHHHHLHEAHPDIQHAHLPHHMHGMEHPFPAHHMHHHVMHANPPLPPQQPHHHHTGEEYTLVYPPPRPSGSEE